MDTRRARCYKRHVSGAGSVDGVRACRRRSVAAIVAALVVVSGAGDAAAQNPQRGGTVVVNRHGNAPPCLNLFEPKCNAALNFAARDLLRQILLGAFDVGVDGRPLVVSKVDYTTTAPFTLTYRIRSSARWSDGVPVSAADFVFTFEAFRKHLARDSGIADLLLEAVQSVRALGPKVVRVVLRHRVAGWRTLFDIILPRHALEGEDLASIWTDRIDNPKTRVPIASGPFVLAQYERDRPDPRIVLIRNAAYGGRHRAYLDRILLWWSGRTAREELDALRTGEIHVTPVQADVTLEARRATGLRRHPLPAPTWEHFEVRIGPGGHPALKDKLVRRALAYGIDRQSIVRELFGEADPDVRPSDSAVFFAQSRHYVPHWNAYRYRPGRARGLLDQAGCKVGADGVRVCEKGGRLTLRFVTTAGRPDRELVLRRAQAQLRALGVLVEPEYVPSGALFGERLASGDFDVALFTWVRSPDSPGLVDVYGCRGPRNFTGYCQRLVTRDLDQAERILDAGERARVLNRADAQMARDAPVVPLYQPVGILATQARLHGAVFKLGSLWNYEDWWLER